ncbi:NUMOD4 domain-containing protein [Enterococcus italicus]|uniref:NUMOD4 domain-containing protein n=1 Tax=Enterococcus italicus TaxID=246144 RepID=UPI003F47F132
MVGRLKMWKDIIGYEGLYEVSSCGEVRNVRTDKLLKLSMGTCGYYRVNLRKNLKPRTFLVHRLVAEAFLDNADGKPQVNHIDENKTNNSVENLEWCTSKHNANHGTRIERCHGVRRNNTRNTRPVKGIRIVDDQLIFFPSANEAGRNGFDKSSVINCCNGKRGVKSHKGYRWMYQ